MKKFPFKYFLLAVVFLYVSLTVFGQDDRSFDQEMLKEFKNDSEFNYTSNPVQYPGFLDILISFLGRAIRMLLYPFSKVSPDWLTMLAYGVLVVIILYAITKFLNLDVNSMFFSAAGKSGRLNLSEEELLNLDLESSLRDSLAKKDYRLAIRFLYLISLQQLAGKDIIHLKPGKTSTDYLHEINDEIIYRDFNRLNYYFEYGWYGEFPIDQQIFEKANTAYQHFMQQLK